MEPYCIAVFDVGKTNKKLLLFDHNLQLLDSTYNSFPEVENEGIRYEDIEAIELWFEDRLREFAASYDIRAISVTTHGAAFVTVDREGRIATPVTSYTTEVDDSFNDEFYRIFGDSRSLQRVTATPRFDALLNVAKGIYFAKRRFPAGFSRIHAILNYPQYFGYRLTGNIGAEWTYVGCHSYLWDFSKMRWSSVAEKLGVLDKLPEKVVDPWTVLGKVKPELAQRLGLSAQTAVTMGVHDSNASLLPYLIKTKEEFILNSTGTWCVLMHPVREAVFDESDIGKVVFYNLDVFSHPVKTAIFTGGMEFNTYTDLIGKINGVDRARDGEAMDTSFDAALYRRIVKDKKLFILPEVLKGSGQFPDSLPRIVEEGREYPLSSVQSGDVIPGFLRDPRTAVGVLNLSLLIQTRVALERTGYTPGMAVFVEGGFRQNQAYGALLSALLPDSRLAYTGMREATAFGAAILGKAAAEELHPMDAEELFDIDYSPVGRHAIEGLNGYSDAFLSRI